MFQILNLKEQKTLIELARESILAKLEQREPKPLILTDLAKYKLGVFVSLYKGYARFQRTLRGCIGTLINEEVLAKSIPRMALAAAFEDPRFPPLTLDELDQIRIELSILTPLEESMVQDIIAKLYGVYLVHKQGSAVFLPQVARQQNWNTETFLEQLSLKAGLHNKAYLDKGTKLYRFQAFVFAEKFIKKA